MAELQVGGKTLVTQTGTDNPVLGSTVNIPSGVTFPAGHVIQVIYWRITPIYVATSGSWAWDTNPTGSATYAVDNTTFTKKSSTSKIIGVATGHVDSTGTLGTPTVISLTNGGGSAANGGGTIYGAAYMHLRYNGNEPFSWNFGFEDDCQNQIDIMNPVYYLRCHSSGTGLYFSRMSSGTTPNNPYTIIFYEVEQ